MKHPGICPILLVLSLALHAQTNNPEGGKPPDPPFLNHVYYWEAYSLLSLEQADAQAVSKTRALGFGGSEGGYALKGERSPVRVKAGDPLRFAVKMGMSMTDPSLVMKLYRFNIRKGEREAVISSSGGPYSKGKNDNTSEISYNIQKFGQDLFIILPASGLSPGEYGFLNMITARQNGTKVSFTVFAFGVE